MYNILCVKHGTKYSVDYVNKLYNMVKRNTTLPFTFHCFTDDITGIDDNIQTHTLPTELNLNRSWWYKLYLFKKDLFPENTVNFYLDLDIVITDNIDCLLEYEVKALVGPRDYFRARDESTKHLNSSIMRWDSNTFTDLWEDFDKNVTISLRGDQDYIWQQHSDDIYFFPDEWTSSYRWEYVLQKRPFNKIVVFHGDPKPHQIDNGIVKEHWN